MIKQLLISMMVLNMAIEKDIFIAPPSLTEGNKQMALVLIIGARCDPQTYVPIAEQIRSEFNKSKVDLFIAIPDFLFHMASEFQIDGKVRYSIDQLKQIKMDPDAETILMGHSLGGIVAQDYINSNINIKKNNIKRLVLLGCTMARKYRRIDQNTGETWINHSIENSLTVLGTKDGLLRVTRGVEAFYHQQLQIVQKQRTQHRVVVIEGIAHQSFMNQNYLTSFVRKNDLKPQLSEQQGYQNIAELVVSDVLGNRDTSYHKVSDQLMNSYVEMFVLESSYHIKTPCYNQKLENPQSNLCQKGSKWVNMVGQSGMAGDLDQAQLTNSDNFHRVYSINPVHLPIVLNSCNTNRNDEKCVLRTITVSQNVYVTLDEADTGLFPISASEIRSKLSSRQNIQSHLGKQNPDFHVLDEQGDRCAEINQKAIDIAEKVISDEAKLNYQKYGRKMVVGKDLGPYNAGPLWIWKALKYQNNQTHTVVSAPMMRTPTNYLVKSASGFHYCKLLSPFRVLEHILIDSIKGREDQ